MRARSLMKTCLSAALILTAAACGAPGNNKAGNEVDATAGNEAAPVADNNAAPEGNVAADTGAPAANATAGSRPAAPYEASGSEPFWTLTVTRGQLTYDPADGPHIRITTPPRQPIPNGYRYVTPQITVEVVHTRCQADNEQFYADTVRVHVGDVNGEGCGE